MKHCQLIKEDNYDGIDMNMYLQVLSHPIPDIHRLEIWIVTLKERPTVSIKFIRILRIFRLAKQLVDILSKIGAWFTHHQFQCFAVGVLFSFGRFGGVRIDERGSKISKQRYISDVETQRIAIAN